MNDGRGASYPAHPRDSPSDPWAGLPAKRGPVAAPGGGIPGPRGRSALRGRFSPGRLHHGLLLPLFR